MTRRLPAYMQTRSMYTRTNANLLLNTPDGWVATQTFPMPWGAVGADSPPAWWRGSDQWNGGPIGPNGPWRNSKNSILPGVTRCTNIIVGSIVRAPWRLADPDGNLQEDRPAWLGDPMLLGTIPGPSAPLMPAGFRLDRLSFWSTWTTHALWWGQGAFVFVEGFDGLPIAGSFRLLNPFMVWPDEQGHWVIDPNGENPVVTDADGRIPGTRLRLVVLRGMPPNDEAIPGGGMTPGGVLTRHYATLRLGASVSQYVADMFASGGIPSGFLKVTTPGLKKAEADALKSSWMDAHGSGPRGVAVLNSTVDYQPITLSPVDANAAELIHTTRADIAHCFNMSAVWLDEGQSGLTYNNNSDRRRDLIDLTLAAPAGKVGAVLSALLPYGWELSKDFSGFTQATFEETVPVLVSAVEAGLMTGLEARQRLGLAADTGPDPAWQDNSPATKDPVADTPPQLLPFTGQQDQQQGDSNAQQQ